MAYRVVRGFIDSQDENHDYNVGDEYPRKGKKVTKKRIAELSSDKNRKGKPFIEETDDE